MATLGAIGQQIGLGDLGTVGSIVMAMAADPHMLLAAASLVPGLGSLAAAMDMALYLYEGDSFNAALAAAALIPGGAILAIGVGKGIKALVTMAQAGAPGLRAAIGGSRVVQGLGRAGGAVSRVVRSVRTRISRLIGKTDDLGRDVGKVADDWKVAGNVGDTGRAVGGGRPTFEFEMQLDRSVLGESRKVHFNRANEALDQAFKADPNFARQMESRYPGIVDSVSATGGRANPSGLRWHHAPSGTVGGRTGVMQLVPEFQHSPGSAWWKQLHPDGFGGYSEWAIPAGAPPN